MLNNPIMNSNIYTNTMTQSPTEQNIMDDQYIETPWNIIESYFKGQHLERLVRHQLESYNDFVGQQIVKTIEMFNPVHIASEQDYDVKSGKYSLELFVTYENFHIYRPQIHENNGATKLMFPQEARLRNFTYASAMTLDINIKFVIRNGENLDNTQTFYKSLPKIHIGKLPIMLKSNICVLSQYKHVSSANTGECKFDAGGYFIINGSEKIVLGQERAAENKVYCFNVSKNNTKYTWMAEVKSVPDFKCISPKQINMMVSSKNNGFGCALLLQLPRVKQPIPLFIVFRALGVISDKEICEKILLNIDSEKYKDMLDGLQASIIEANILLTQEEAIRYITNHVMYTPINMDKETGAKKKHEFTMDILGNDLFPHCKTPTQKMYFLGYMANKLLQASFDWVKQDDRDSYLNKRVDLTGSLLNNLFRNYFNKLVKDMEKQIIKEINTGSWKSTDDYENIVNQTNIYKIIKSTTIENGLKRALSTGDFGIKHTNSNKVGVAQVLNRLTYVSSLSHARRISTPVDKSGKLIPPRKLHSTSWGFLCPAETPEGQSVGVVKNLAYMAHITIHSSSLPIYEYIMPHIIDIESIPSIDMYNKVKVFINGCWIGITDNPKQLYEMLKEKKNQGIINIYTSVVFDYKMAEIRVCNDAGRLTRPLLRVKNNKTLFNDEIIKNLVNNKLEWNDLMTNCKLNDAVLEYIDPEEQSWSMLAMKPTELSDIKKMDEFYRYTHCEIHPSTIFGILGSCVPFPEHNQSPRNTYQCLDINETVLLSSGEKIRIAEVREGDSVLCFHPETMEQSYTTVVNHYVRKTDKKLYKITTLSDREIIATEDHKFMTTEGWRQVKDMKTFKKSGSTKIGILPYQTNHVNEPDSDEEIMIVTEKQFREFCLKAKITPLLLDKYVNELKEKDLLPLYNTKYSSYKLPVIARIFGVIYSEGTIINDIEKGHEFMINFIDMDNVVLFKNDLELCGFRKDAYTYQPTSSITKIFCSGALPTMLLVLGIASKQCVPQWILNGSKIVKREFLSAIKNNYEIIRNPESGTFGFLCNIVLEKYVGLLEEFDITIQKTTNCFGSHYNIENDYNNLIQYYDKIGYRYSSVKNTQSSLIVEYLKYCLNASNFMDYETWMKQTIVFNNMLFVPIKSIELVSNDLVSDITVESENHSFIAGNNFLSSNCAQAKQAMGVYVTNYENRMDKTAYVLNYPARPLVDTRIMDMIHINKIPSGFNVVVAIMTHTGYNQEDSLLFNKGSIDRGLFQATIYHTEKDEDKQKINGDEEIRCKPDPSKTKGMKFANYNKVNSKGVIPENTLIENRDVIISKITPIKENRNDHTKVIKYEDQSRIYRTDEETFVDKNYIDRNGDGYNFAKVRIRAVRKPVIGDKFSSRSGQKGTIGNIIPEEDMPFTKDGIRPDIILNPHAIPSRMTIAHLKETVLAKVLLELGLFGDGTSFGELSINIICDELLKVGYEAHGNELLYNGLTGEQHECSVFTGPVFYQRLKHMVIDKQHSRSIGPMVNLTRQPAEGRSRDGGLRFGEMERDTTVAHGAARFTKERLFDVSDKYSVYSCKKCGMIASYNDAMHIHRCRTCDNRTDFAYVQIPYACKLLFQELITMNIAPRIMTIDN